MRKIFFFFILAGLIAFFSWFFLIQKTYRNPLAEVQAIEAIPRNTPIILKFDDYFMMRHALTKMPYAEEMSDAFFIKKMSKDFRIIRQLFSKNKNHRQLLLDSPITASLHLSRKKEVDFLYVIVDNNGGFELKALLDIFPHKKSTAQGNTVYSIEVGKKETYTIAVFKDLVLVSKYAYLVESGLQQLKNPATNLLNDDRLDFLTKKIRGEHQVEVTVLFENLKIFVAPFLKKNVPNYWSYFSKNIPSGKWILDFDKEGIRLDGGFKINNESALLRYFIKNNAFTISKSKDVLPKTVAYFFRHSLKEEVAAFSKKEGATIFERYFLPWMGEEWLTGRVEVFTRKMNAEKFVAFHSRSPKKAQYYLQKLSDSLTLLNSWEYQTYAIRQLSIEQLPIPYAGGETIFLQNPCYVMIDDYVVFAGAARILENWIDQYLTGQTLSSQVPYLKMKSHAGKTGALEFYWNGKTASQFLQKTFKTESVQAESQLKIWENLSAFGINGRWGEEEIETTGFLFFQKQNEKRTDVRWRTPLQAAARTSPFVVFNDEKNELDILIQDEDNRLYLLNAEGEIVWDMELEYPILSKIVATDFSEEESAMIIFNTQDKIYLIDFDGRNKNDFPIRLASPATNGLLLANFGDHNQAFFVACENGKLYGFDENGIPLSGWNEMDGVGEVSLPRKHFQTEEKDYIVVTNSAGHVFSFWKNGTQVSKVEHIGGVLASPLCFQLEKNGTEMVVAEQDGQPKVIDLENKKVVLLQKGNKKTDSYFFASADIGGDNQTDYAVLKNNELGIYYRHQNQFKEYGSYRFSNQQDAVFCVQSKGMGKAMIGTVCEKQSQIFLFDKKGSLHADFPLAGTTKFVLVHLFEDEEVVLVADKNQVVAYGLGGGR